MLNEGVVLITGGTRGIGYAVAKKLANDNITTIVTSRENIFCEDEIKPNSINYQSLDVTNEASVDRLFSWISNQKFKLAVLINNAGVGVFKSLLETSLEDWNFVLTTNLSGAFLCSKQAFRLMQESGGRIINIGSIVELSGTVDNSAYAASKSGLKSLSLVISEEGKNYNITSTHLTLGAVYSEIWKERAEFNVNDMLDIQHVANTISYIANLPSNIRMDTLEITPMTKIL